MDEYAEASLVEWREWGQEAFEEAQQEEKPVLLSLSARWCDWCHEMDETTFSRPTIAANLNERFVPIRVDVDRQPRVRERYNMGGFPSTVFATSEGIPMTGATFLGPDGMRGAIESVYEVWAEKGGDAGRIPRAVQNTETPSGKISSAIGNGFVERLGEAFDREHGGWGDAPKFPLARTIEFALDHEPEQALAALNAVTRHLQDDYGGGFFRYAETRSWGDPHTEKLLVENAALLRAYTVAYRATDDETYLEPARRTAEFLTTTLWNGAAFAASQAPDEEFYELEPADRESADLPAVDPVALADGNALAVDALLAYADASNDESAREFAIRALKYVRETLLNEGMVSHYDDERSERSLLTDQAAVLRALITATDVLDDEEYLVDARAVADHALEALRDDGAFLDGSPVGLGILDRPLKPLDGNAELADALVDLSVFADEDRYADAARESIAAFAGASDRMGAEAAQYVVAANRFVDRDR